MTARPLLLTCLFSTVGFAGPLERGIERKTAGDFPAAERELAAATREEPRNAQAWYHYGVVLGWEGKHAEARAALDRGLTLVPGDYDLRFARARVLAWQGDYAAAEKELAALAAINPADNDVLVMRGRIAGWEGRPAEAEAFYQEVLASDPNHADALSGMGDLARNETSSRADFGVTASDFPGSDRESWWSVWTQYSRRTAIGTFWGRLEQGERFGGQDTTLEAGWEGTPVDSLNVRLFAGGSPDADWAPKWYVESGVRWAIEEGWPDPVLEIRYAEYVPRAVTTFRGGFDWSFGEGWKIGLRGVHQDFENGRPTNGWIAFLDKEHASGFGWRLGAASGAESLDGQSLSGGDVLRSHTYFGGIRQQVGETWGWRADLEYEDVENGSNRRGVALSVHFRF